jgi:hypothetical protein
LAGDACNYCRIFATSYKKYRGVVVGLKGRFINYTVEIFERTNFIIFGKKCLPYSIEYRNPEVGFGA